MSLTAFATIIAALATDMSHDANRARTFFQHSQRTMNFPKLGAALFLLPMPMLIGEPPSGPTEEEDIEAYVVSVCARCHLFPPPESLPKSSWRTEILKMADLSYLDERDGWHNRIDDIIAYYESLSPSRLQLPEAPAKRISLSSYSISKGKLNIPIPTISKIASYDLFPSIPGDELICSDLNSGTLFYLSSESNYRNPIFLAKARFPASIQIVDFDSDGLNDILVGNLGWNRPTQESLGSIAIMRGKEDGTFEEHKIGPPLGRVSDARAADVDGDGDLDIVATVFGLHRNGSLLYLENIGGSTTNLEALQLKPHALSNASGGIAAPIVDLDGDGDMDIVALYSQEHEEVVAYYQSAPSEFQAVTLFKAPHPNWGFNAIEIDDLDGDGDVDIILSNGDSMDDSISEKPYHGIAWLENRGSRELAYARIGHFIGPTGLQTGDWNGDGTKDVIVSSWVSGPSADKRNNANSHGLAVFIGSNDKSFSRVDIATSDSGIYPSLLANDLTGDGQLDLAVGRYLLSANDEREKSSLIEIFENQSARH